MKFQGFEFEERLSALDHSQALMYLSMIENNMQQVITVDEAVQEIVRLTETVVYTPTIGGSGKAY